MRIFLTGGSGFVGKSVLKELIARGHRMLLLSRNPDFKKFGLSGPKKNVKFLKGDLSNVGKWIGSVKRFKPDGLVHLAWEGLPETGVEMSIRNLKQGLDLFNALAGAGAKHIVAVGTQWEYGNRKGMAREKDSLLPFNPLAAAKISLELFGEEIAKSKNIKFSWLRLFSVYGPGQRLGGLIPSATRSFLSGDSLQVRSLDARNDFVYIDDVSRAIAMVVKNQKKQIGVYNVASGKLTSVREIIGLVYKKFGKRMDKNLKSYGTSHVPGLLASISKIKSEIGWKPDIDIEEGVSRTVDYLRNL